MFNGMTRAEVRSWAGDRIFERGEEYIDNVYDLYRTEEGGLVAWVEGTDQYAVRVDRSAKGLFDYECTCPYDFEGPCKHVVAVLLVALGTKGKLDDLPLVDPEDDVWLELYDDPESLEDLDDDSEEGGSFTEHYNSPKDVEKQVGLSIEQALDRKTREELLALLEKLSKAFPIVKQAIRDQYRLETGEIDALADALRREIRLATSEPAWSDSWKDQRHLPDYSPIQRKLEDLLAAGQADLVIEIGEELWEQGIEQLQESNDEGQTAQALADCMACVVRALPVSSLTVPEQILWQIEHAHADEYGVLEEMPDIQSNPTYHAEHWREVSLVLEQRLASTKSPDFGSQHERFARGKLINRLCDAYEKCGDESKIVPLLEQEVDRCLCYNKLVKTLMDTGDIAKARQWCIHGYHHTIQTFSGIAADLWNRLRELASLEGRSNLVAAYRAHEYIKRPSMKGYEELRRVVQDIHAWPVVREKVLRYLQTGKLPWAQDQDGGAWPLPPLEVETAENQEPSTPIRLSQFPRHEDLVRIALDEQRYDDAVKMYDDLAKQTAWSVPLDNEVAKAVSASHPDLSLKIWRNIVDRFISQVNSTGYYQASTYLQLMHQVYEDTGRLAEWEVLLRQLRLEHKLKRNFIAVLRDLEEQISADS